MSKLFRSGCDKASMNGLSQSRSVRQAREKTEKTEWWGWTHILSSIGLSYTERFKRKGAYQDRHMLSPAGRSQVSLCLHHTTGKWRMDIAVCSPELYNELN
ncbi:uncharacterized protein LOC112589610 [Harpegnathos saltator]|uniref:uncharacterized protein LOC112589610 n=1 Tax=Harpegnathos saltator TaxID=610380 RepID=UPI000DBEE03C|nr:uncharacterized protein LOC112589610 [Harpegnathos saltator]